MKRTQLYLKEDRWRNLSIAKEIEHFTISELIRQAIDKAIDKVYAKKETSSFERTIDCRGVGISV